MKIRDAKYWRIYYKFQGMLEKEYLNKFETGSSGGVREQSTLPPALNLKAHELTETFMNGMDEALDFTNCFKPPITLNHSHVDRETYELALSELHPHKRDMLNPIVGGDDFYISRSGLDNTVVGGFTVANTGYLEGLFTLRRGFGPQMLKAQVLLTIDAVKCTGEPRIERIHTYCFSGRMSELLLEEGFELWKILTWDERLAPKGWNTAKYGMPSVHYFRRAL